MTNFLGEAHRSTTRARALKGVALSAVTLAMVAPGFAQAQDVQEVTITGSRIRAPNLTSDSPVSAACWIAIDGGAPSEAGSSVTPCRAIE